MCRSVSVMTLVILLGILARESDAQMSTRSLSRRRAPVARTASEAVFAPAVISSNSVAILGLDAGNHCQSFIATEVPKDKLDDKSVSELKSCADELRDKVPDTNAPGSSPDKAMQTFEKNFTLSTQAQVDLQLTNLRYLIRLLRRWADLEPDPYKKSSLVTDLDLIDAHLRAIMHASEEDCQYFVDTKYSKTKPSDFETPNGPLTKLKSCAEALEKNIPDTGTAGADVSNAIKAFKATYNLSTTDQVDEQLSTTHYLSRLRRRWATLDRLKASDVIAELDNVDGRLHDLMKAEGLLDKFAGVLVAGPAFGETGKTVAPGTTVNTNGTSTTGTAAVSSQSTTNTLAHVEWGSQHFGDESWFPADFSFGGMFGLQPALSLLTAQPATTGTSGASSSTVATSTPPTTPQYQSAFVWNLSARGNIHSGPWAETTAYWKSGQVRLLSGNGATVIDQGANSTLQIPLNGNADRASWFHEGGMEFNFYNKALEVIHAEKGQLDPAFNIGVGYKWDTRFKRDNGVVGFDSPDRRLVVRFMINGLKILDKRPDTTGSKTYTVSFGIQHERGFGKTPVPSGTLLIIRADINLLKLINPGSGS